MQINTQGQDLQTNYHLLNGGITPRPIAWISTRSTLGIDNIAPYSFFTVASCHPPVLMYTQISQRNGNTKDTLQNLLETKECVVNIVSNDLLEKMNQSSESFPPMVSEFNAVNISYQESNHVTPYSVSESPIRYECKLRQTISVGESAGSGTIVLLDVVSVYVNDELYNQGRITQEQLSPVGKVGGNGYAVNAEYIELARPE